jgi:hypothetical protein
LAAHLMFARQEHALSSLSRELRGSGRSLGACVLELVGPAALVVLDADGSLWCLRRDSRVHLAAWGRLHGLLVYPSLSSLVGALRAGKVVGLLSEAASSFGVPFAA